jgi:hypothetical protein
MQNRYADFFSVYTNLIAARGFLLCYGSAVTFHDLHVGKGSGPLHGQTVHRWLPRVRRKVRPRNLAGH